MSDVTSEDIDRIFDEGGEVLPHADMSTFERPNQLAKQKRVSVDMTPHMVARLDERALQIGISRQALIKVWISDRLNQEDEREIARKTVIA